MRRKKILLLSVLLICHGLFGKGGGAIGQTVALKTNALYLVTATPNVGVEVGLGYRHTAQLFYGFNPWKSSSGRSLRHWVLQPEYRYWFCETFNGWFVGAHLMGGQFNAGNIDLPLGILGGLKDHRYEGWFAGGGVSFGYQWVMSRHWNFEASLGVGYDYIKYKKYNCGTCGKKIKSTHSNYVGPTKVAVSAAYIF